MGWSCDYMTSLLLYDVIVPGCFPEIDHCLPNPCDYGECENSPDGPNCVCNPGFTGEFCQTRKSTYTTGRWTLFIHHGGWNLYTHHRGWTLVNYYNPN